MAKGGMKGAYEKKAMRLKSQGRLGGKGTAKGGMKGAYEKKAMRLKSIEMKRKSVSHVLYLPRGTKGGEPGRACLGR